MLPPPSPVNQLPPAATPYRVLAVEHKSRDRVRVDIELGEIISLDELTRLAEQIQTQYIGERTSLFYSLRDDPKPTMAWATSQCRKGHPPLSEIMGVTLENLQRINAVTVPGQLIGDWISESNLFPRLALVIREGRWAMQAIHKDIFMLQDNLVKVGSAYRIGGTSELGCHSYRVEADGNLALLTAEGRVLTLFRRRQLGAA